MTMNNSRRRGLKICVASTFVVLIVLTTVIVTLAFTIFKPKDPEISVKPMGLQNLSFSSLNVSLNMMITIVNRNYGGFRYENCTSYVAYHDVVLADVPMETNTIPARSTVHVTSVANLNVGKMISNPKFLPDLLSGTLNLTSMATIPGKAIVLKIFKMKATVRNTCEISINVTSRAAHTKCKSKIKF